MRVLVACEWSGTVRDAFIRRGYDAVSCDVLPSTSPGPHIRDDVRYVLNDGWDLMIAHPPCQYLAHSGVRWLWKKTDDTTKVIDELRWAKMLEAIDFFNLLYNAAIPRVCIENPTMHRYARERVPNYDQEIHPWEYGHPEKKRTRLWLKNLPPLRPTDIVEGREEKIHKMGQTKDRAKKRGKFLTGWADAMAEQWAL